MTTDNDTNFGPVVTTPSTSFGMVFQNERDMPLLDCVDLFPNPPRQIDDISQDVIENLSTDNVFADLSNISNDDSVQSAQEKSEDGKVKDADPEEKCHFDLTEIRTEEPTKSPTIQTLVEDKIVVNEDTPVADKNPSPVFTQTQNVEDTPIEDRKTPNRLQFPLPVVSPALSISSYYSSAESVSSATSSNKKKKRKRHCLTCDLHFHHKSDLLDHLKVHVSEPLINLEALPDDDIHVQEYRDRQFTPSEVNAEDILQSEELEGGKSISPQQHEGGGLKLKLKLSGSQNFQVVPITRLTEKREPVTKKPSERIITAQEVQKSPPPSVATRNGGPLDAMVALSKMQGMTQHTDESILENKYFECPTLDGLDQFAEEINSDVAEDLLKKLLEGQQIPHETDWASSTNEFIPLDRLAYMCTVCNANFPDAIRLYEHKRITGHDFQHPMHPPPPPSNMPNMEMANHYRMRPPFQPQLTQPMPNAPGMHQVRGPPMNMRPNFQGYPPPHQQPQRFHPAPNFNQMPQARRPPPLYRVPVPQNTHPLNMTPFAEMNPEMYIPSSNGNTVMNGHFQPTQAHMERQPAFFKARLQKPMLRPKTPGMHDRSPSATPSPPVVLSQQTITRPRFLGPMPSPMIGPPAKKIKQESGLDDCEIVSTQPSANGLPVIQSVQGGAIVASGVHNEKPKDPIQLNDQITLSIKNKEQNKNPKEVASILANRGITVTHKAKPTGAPSREPSPKNIAQEAVHKLQLNNSVSIISKKRPTEGLPAPTMEETNRIRQGDLAFMSCPIADCDEKFLTQEGLNRHTQRGHRMSKVPLRTFKCKLCHAMFSTQEGLIDHQRRSHRVLKTSADEVGIPIIDLRNEDTKRKLAQLGIVNYIPLNAKSANGCFGFPIVSVQGAGNPNICNMMGMGVNSLLSLGPIKQIPLRKLD